MIVIPGLPLVMVIASFVPQRSWQLVAFVLRHPPRGPGAYVLRLQTRSLRTRDYVYASKASWPDTSAAGGEDVLALLTNS
ncbi:hypothetical protein CTI14_55510 [Methylobacterium radiotolerans]|nr:hypothetical protein CTI14_55510 [Methylobacterium radiotolerans]